MGDGSRADASKIADYRCRADTSKFSLAQGYIKLNANYQLVMDKLPDLSHVSFVHETTLEPRETAKHEFHVSEEEGHIFTKQWCKNNPITPLSKAVLGMEGLVDRWLEMRFVTPASVMTYYGITRFGEPREAGWDTHNPNIITPETETTTHSFWATCRTFDLQNQQLTEMFREGAKNAFENEDRPMLEPQQELVGSGDLMALKPVLLVNDAGSVRVRRLLARMMGEEALAKPVIPIAAAISS